MPGIGITRTAVGIGARGKNSNSPQQIATKILLSFSESNREGNGYDHCLINAGIDSNYENYLVTKLLILI